MKRALLLVLFLATFTDGFLTILQRRAADNVSSEEENESETVAPEDQDEDGYPTPRPHSAGLEILKPQKVVRDLSHSDYAGMLHRDSQDIADMLEKHNVYVNKGSSEVPRFSYADSSRWILSNNSPKTSQPVSSLSGQTTNDPFSQVSSLKSVPASEDLSGPIFSPSSESGLNGEPKTLLFGLSSRSNQKSETLGQSSLFTSPTYQESKPFGIPEAASGEEDYSNQKTLEERYMEANIPLKYGQQESTLDDLLGHKDSQVNSYDSKLSSYNGKISSYDKNSPLTSFNSRKQYLEDNAELQNQGSENDFGSAKLYSEDVRSPYSNDNTGLEDTETKKFLDSDELLSRAGLNSDSLKFVRDSEGKTLLTSAQIDAKLDELLKENDGDLLKVDSDEDDDKTLTYEKDDVSLESENDDDTEVDTKEEDDSEESDEELLDSSEKRLPVESEKTPDEIQRFLDEIDARYGKSRQGSESNVKEEYRHPYLTSYIVNDKAKSGEALFKSDRKRRQAQAPTLQNGASGTPIGTIGNGKVLSNSRFQPPGLSSDQGLSGQLNSQLTGQGLSGNSQLSSLGSSPNGQVSDLKQTSGGMSYNLNFEPAKSSKPKISKRNVRFNFNPASSESTETDSDELPITVTRVKSSNHDRLSEIFDKIASQSRISLREEEPIVPVFSNVNRFPAPLPVAPEADDQPSQPEPLQTGPSSSESSEAEPPTIEISRLEKGFGFSIQFSPLTLGIILSFILLSMIIRLVFKLKKDDYAHHKFDNNKVTKA
ncbi:unnamed protein product [Bursaphelenchus okinawaensis]|uniref:Uncharacterized protein n=1 Tax=Bursaphelenchus okinawaensis TaxID=465554 RepID=A0A811K4F6_9BILA|nr:unnamed protein product [Bursaphelenchus okinawaensis]CAG9091198.1 unnamed protein product [Bursaphelenchus okinawaensis]